MRKLTALLLVLVMLTGLVSTAAATNSPHFREMSAGEIEAYAGDLHDVLDGAGDRRAAE